MSLVTPDQGPSATFSLSDTGIFLPYTSTPVSCPTALLEAPIASLSHNQGTDKTEAPNICLNEFDI